MIGFHWKDGHIPGVLVDIDNMMLYMAKARQVITWVGSRAIRSPGCECSLGASWQTASNEGPPVQRELEIAKFLSLGFERTNESAYFSTHLFISLLHSTCFTVEWNLQEACWPEMSKSAWWSSRACGECSYPCMVVCQMAALRVEMNLGCTEKERRFEIFAEKPSEGQAKN